MSLYINIISLHVHNYFSVHRSTKEKENTTHHFVSNEHYQSPLYLQQMAVRLFGQVHNIENSAIGLF